MKKEMISRPSPGEEELAKKREESDRPQAQLAEREPFTDGKQQMLRLYNSATGKCDLSEEEARRREAYRQAESEAADRLRRERLEKRQNTLLDPEAKEALGSIYPQVAWDQVQGQVYDAFAEQPEQSYKLLQKYQPDPALDSDDLILLLYRLDPAEGINQFQYLNESVNLKDITKSKPLEVLEEVLRMLTLSDKWQTRG